MSTFLQDNPQIAAIRTAIADLNGQARGKRLPVQFAEKALNGAARLPLSALNVDIKGHDIEDSPLVFTTGDQDGVLRPTERGFVPMPWLHTPTALLPMSMYHEDGTAFAGDPRHALAEVLSRFAKQGLTPAVATELEFYLIDDAGETLQPPCSPQSGKRRQGGEVLSLEALDAFDVFFTELYAACAAMDIPAETASSEGGTGQYEINLTHGDAMKAADDAWLFKQLVRGLARKHGFAASFMAKPYADDAGTGLHMHFSVLDTAGKNIFDNGGPEGSEALRHAVAGCLQAMPGSMLIFAPHGNSYERFAPGSHAPTGIAWGYENRTTALRVPSGAPVARRIEHRVAGGDINPYLMIAAVLGAALLGLEDKLSPPTALTGDAYSQNLPQLPTDWDSAITAVENDAMLSRILPEDLIRNFLMTKKQDRDLDQHLTPADRLNLYLDTV